MIPKELVKEAVGHIRLRSANYEYFFQRLDSLEWVEPLREYGFFKNPPPPVRDRDSISFPFWPEAQFLARMAKTQPEGVIEIILGLPETENVRVHWDLLDAALALPPALAARWTETEATWVEKQAVLDMFLAEKLACLAIHLAKGGKQSEGLRIARVLLQIVPPTEPKKPATTEEEKFSLSLREPRGKFDQQIYEEILKRYAHQLTDGLGLLALNLYCEMLSLAIGTRYEGADRDFSHIWRPAVEEHSQNHIPSLKSSLTTAVRDAAERLSGRDGNLPKVIGLLLDQKPTWPIFVRIALHLLRILVKDFDDQTKDMLLSRAVFEDVDCRHEYVLLLQKWFSHLGENERETILSWMDRPSDLDQFVRAMRDFDIAFRPNHEISDEDISRELRRWKYDHLLWLGNLLPDSKLEEFRRLAVEFGAARSKPPESPSFVTSFVGPVSPLESGALASFSVPEIVEYLRDWTPPDTFMGSSREGLARDLATAVAQNPKRFASEAFSFRQLHPTYVRAILNGFRDAINQGFDWQPVLCLGAWLVEQADERLGRKAPHWVEEDEDWSWSRGALAQLVETALAQDKVPVPFQERRAVWRIIETLSSDADPRPEREAKKDQSNIDFATISINATRGVAMHAVIRYALWVRKNLPKESAGFAEMNEVKEVLEKHLDITQDPSLAIRSVYGRWFPVLHFLDAKWADANASRIFPSDKGLASYWEAAWSSYVGFCAPYSETLSTLEGHYRVAIEKLKLSDQSSKNVWEPSLVGHLMALYWRGDITINSRDRLIQEFFFNARPHTRGHAFETLGRWLFHLKEPLEPTVARRLKQLWKWRIETVRKSLNPAGFAPELVGFGWWFRANVFEEAWLLKQLKNVLEVTEGSDPKVRERLAFPILERLAEISARRSLDAVVCLLTLVRGWKNSWPLSGMYREEFLKILRNALDAGGSAKSTAVEVIDLVTGQGDLGLQVLLRETSRTDSRV